jgi:hypothetical protein
MTSFAFDLPKAFAPPLAVPGIFLDPLMRIAFATLLNKNAFAASLQRLCSPYEITLQ